MKKKIILTFLIFTGIILLTSSLQAQGVSEVDTLRVSDGVGDPGDTVDIFITIVNQSQNVAAFNVQMIFDTSVIRPVVFRDYSPELDDSIWLADPDLRGPLLDFDGPFINQYGYDETRSTLAGTFASYNPNDEFGTGTWEVLKFQFVIADNAVNGTVTDIGMFSDFTPGGVIVYLSDAFGENVVEPTLRGGSITVGGVIIEDPHAPQFDALSNVLIQQNTNVTFTVRATDIDGDDITLSAVSLPSGASFPTQTSNSVVTSTFNWTPSSPGTYSVTFRAADNSVDALVSTRTVTITVQEVVIVSDKLIVMSTRQYGGIKGGIPGTMGIAVPIDINNINDIYGLQFDLVYDQSMCRVDSITPTDRLPGFTIYENIGTIAGSIRVLTFGLQNEKVEQGSSGNTIMNVWTSIHGSAVAGHYPFEIVEAFESINPDPGSASVELPFDTAGVLQVDMLGDVNLNPPVDIADLVSLVAYIIGNKNLTARQFDAANVNGDSEANVVDMVAILNSILTGTPASVPMASYTGPDASIEIDYGDLYAGQTDFMKVNADLPDDVAGVQLEILYNPKLVNLHTPELSSRADDLVINYVDNGAGRMVVLMYAKLSRSAELIEAGLGNILSIPVEAVGDISSTDESAAVRLSDVVLSTSDGNEIPVKGYNKQIPSRFNLSQNYPNPFNPRTTIVFEVMASASSPGSEDVELIIYNLLGQKVKTLASGYYTPGEYSVEWDGTDEYGSQQASGVYFYSLISGKSRVSKKMVLTK
jgi:Putative Ig domain/FlgD Ig-like domain